MRDGKRRGRWTAVGGVLSAIISALINVLTDSWSWWVFALAALLLIVTGSITYNLEAGNEGERGKNRSRVHQRAEVGSRIQRSGVKASSGAEVDQVASAGGHIESSEIEAQSAAVRQNADNGTIVDSPITAT